MSETAKYRELFLPYCKGNGLDLGYGGDKIIPSAIGVDLPQGQRYAFEGDNAQNIECDASNLYMFADEGMDYLYSSHLIEDFEDTLAVLIEWLRVIKIEGYLCLLFPDQQMYEQRGFNINLNHKHTNFGLQYVLITLDQVLLREAFKYTLKVIEAKELFENNDYNCMVIVQKQQFKNWDNKLDTEDLFNTQYLGHFPRID